MESGSEVANILFQITILAILTLINAFSADSEMAVVSVNKNKIHRPSEQDNKNAAFIERPIKDSTILLSAIQVVIALTGFLSSASTTTGITQVLAVWMAQWNVSYSRTLARVVVTIILAYFNLVSGELVPKRIALRKTKAFSLFCVRPIYYISRIMNPPIKLFSLSTSDLLKLTGICNKNSETDVSEEEIKSILETGSEVSVFNDVKKKAITPTFSFDNKRVREVMVPRQDMVTLDINEPLKELLDETLESIHSKIPVYRGEIDNIISVLPTEALIIGVRRASFDKLDVRALLRPVLFMPESCRTDALFREMQVNKARLAILIDEYGGVPGMMTPEDLVEEVVSDTHEEYEEEEPELTELELYKVHRVSGDITLFSSREEMHLHTDSSCDILSGHLTEQLGYIPSREQLPLIVVTPEADCEILEAEDRVIGRMKLTLKETKKEQEEWCTGHSIEEGKWMSLLLEGIMVVIWQQAAMYVVGVILIQLTVKKEYEPSLLLPLDFGVILVNLLHSSVVDQMVQEKIPTAGVIEWLFKTGIEASEVISILLFIRIDAMIDFGPLLSQPVLSLFGAAAQFGISAITLITYLMGFDLRGAVSTGIIGAADGPTSVLVSQILGSEYIGPIAVAAYSYTVLAPIIQPFAIRLVTTRKECHIHMEYDPESMNKQLRTAFPIAVTIIVGLIPPQSVTLAGFLVFGNLLRKCGVLGSLKQMAQNEFANIITLLPGITISFSMRTERFVNPAILMIIVLGLAAFVLDAVDGVLFAKLINVFLEMTGKKPVNPIIGGRGASAFPMSSRVVQKMAAKEEPGNIILVQAANTNVSGQVASVIASGLVISIVSQRPQDGGNGVSNRF